MLIRINYKLANWNETININRTNRYAAASKKKKEMQIVGIDLFGIPKIEKYQNNL